MKDKTKRTIRLYTRVNEIEYQRILRQMEKVKESGVKTDTSKFLRERALSKNTIVIKDLKEVSRQLLKIGNNINQLTILAHKGNIKTISLEKFTQDIQSCKQQIEKII